MISTMKISIRYSIGLVCLVIAAVSYFTAGSAWAVDRNIAAQMTPHKALYDIRMVSKNSGSQIVNISGKMFYEWRSECDAWVTNHRFNLLYEYADSLPMKITSDFSTYETYDGKSFNFSSRRKRNGEVFQELRGAALFDEERNQGAATYSVPEGLSYDLNASILFPMAHTIGILEYAAAGKRFFNARIFDGSDEDGPVEINAFIGEYVDAAARMPALDHAADNIDMALINTPARKVRMAFFPLSGTEADAEYEMDAIFHESGIISDMYVEYRDFAVSQTLVALETVAEHDCDGLEGVMP